MDFYRDITAEKKITTQEFKEIWNNDVIREAVFLASPELSENIEKWFNDELKDAKKIQGLRYALLKYISRMCCRCTPFGLFAGCNIGEFGADTHIELEHYTENMRQTRFDMNFLVALSQKLSGKAHFKKQLLWYPNTSLYRIGKQYRYIEYTYNKHNRREHSIEAVSYTPYLETVLKEARSGSKTETLAALLTDDDISMTEAETYIEALIDNQVLVSELEPSVTGEDFLAQLKKGFEKLAEAEAVIKEINRYQEFMNGVDCKLGNATQDYINFSRSIESSETPFELKYLFQTDLYIKTKNNTLHQRWAYRLKRAMTLLNKISPPTQSTSLQQFKDAFLKRYETREIPLTTALDTEIGIGYLQNQGADDSTPFLDDLSVPAMRNVQQSFNWDSVQEILYKKLQETLYNKAHVLLLNDQDFEQFEAKWDDLPDTMSAMVEIVGTGEGEKMALSHMGGSSAANLLGRFSTGSPQMLEHVMHITDAEKQMHPDKILAEIIHLPESRTGNVIRRAGLRDYEIPYLGRSQLPVEQQLPIDDLMISVKRDRIVLRSVTHHKEVLPRLTNAHNYSINTLPVYHFLCDLQRQNQRSGIGFRWGGIHEKQSFLPRVVYKDFILSRARWKIEKKDIAPLTDNHKNNEDMISGISVWRAKRGIPAQVQLKDADNTLLIDMEHPDAVHMWLDAVKKRYWFILEEFLFDNESIVKQNGRNYTNQFVISFYNEERYDNAMRH